jgi:predicted NAD/FAD-dependent oxidoreductase
MHAAALLPLLLLRLTLALLLLLLLRQAVLTSLVVLRHTQMWHLLRSMPSTPQVHAVLLVMPLPQTVMLMLRPPEPLSMLSHQALPLML